MKKVVLFAFNGELMCFVHVLLNALDMESRGYETGIVLEGASVTLVPELVKPETPFHALYLKAKQHGLILGACKACSAKLKVLDAVQAEGLELLGDMQGHPAVATYLEQGYQVLTF